MLVMLQEVSIKTFSSSIQREDLGSGWTLLYTSAYERGRGGVGVLVGPRLRRSICCYSLSSRLMRIDLRLKSRNAHLFCAYAPTAASPDAARDFFDFLSGQLEKLPQRDTVMVLGDLNAVMRKSHRAPFVTSKENANTETLVDFLLRHDLVSANTRFRKPAHRLATFVGCKRRRRNCTSRNATTRLAQLDHVLLRYRERRRVANCDTIKTFALMTDHKLLFCDLRLKDPLYRPPKRLPTRGFQALEDEVRRDRFSTAFTKALISQGIADYSNISMAVKIAADRTLPLVRPPQNGRPVWESDPEVKRARLKLERLRRSQQHDAASEAEVALATTFKERQRAAVEEAIDEVSVAGVRKNSAVWRAVNTLTGRRRRHPLSLIGETADARRNELRDFFAAIVNAPSPPPVDMALPLEVALPDEGDFDVAPFTVAEVASLALSAPKGKATGPDDVPVEALQVPAVCEAVAEVMNRVLLGGPAPPEWTSAHIVAIPKKPGSTRKEDHRGISLMSCSAKLFNKALLKRLQPVIDPFLRREQNGFRPHRSTTTHVLTLRRVIEEARTFQSTLFCIFIDFQKAFDSVSRAALASVLRAYHVPQRLVSAIMALYECTQAAVVTPDGLSNPFSTTSGVLQGDTLAPFLFVILLDWVLRVALPSEEDGFLLRRRTSSRHPEKRLSVLGYADDLALLSSSEDGAQRMFNSLVATAAKVGLHINTKKTMLLTVPADLPASISYCGAGDGQPVQLPRCARFCYLGGLVPSIKEDLQRRRGLAWAAFRSIRVVLQCATLPDRLRARLFQAVIETVLLYNAETWTITDSLEKRIDAAHSALLRASFSIHFPARVTNHALYRRAGLQPASTILQRRRLKLAGHAIRAETYCAEPVQDVLLLTLQGLRRRGQARTRRYVDNLLEDVRAPDYLSGVNFIRDLALKRAL